MPYSKTEYALIAQSVEHAAVNRGVTGSSPVWGARKRAVHAEHELLFSNSKTIFLPLTSCFGRRVAAVN